MNFRNGMGFLFVEQILAQNNCDDSLHGKSGIEMHARSNENKRTISAFLQFDSQLLRKKLYLLHMKPSFAFYTYLFSFFNPFHS